MTAQSAFRIVGQNRDSSIVVTCDHASNRVPVEVHGGDLGVPPSEMERHIAYDVGAAGVSENLGELLNVPVILSNFSRLVIDPNRGEDDPTLVMKLYDGTLIPANRHVAEADMTWRLENCYRPYHRALGQLIESREQPVVVSIHSFTPQLAGRPKRPWHIGILYSHDRRLADRMLRLLRDQSDICVGENEPYGGHLDGDSIDKHALRHGYHNILIELRNDLIGDAAGQKQWAERLAPLITQAIKDVV
jgi:predicted N-formylglutamate amidohydrolase